MLKTSSEIIDTSLESAPKADSINFDPLPRLVGLHRKNGGIVAVVSVLTAPLPYQIPTLDIKPYGLIETPLAQLNKGLFARKSRLLDAWQSLQAVSSPDTETLKNILIVLLETELSASDDTAEPALPDLRPVAEVYKPTAAHPRAYKGTKSKPPKSATAVYDLQPLLFTEKGVNFLLQQLAEYKPKALVQLKQLGYGLEQIECAIKQKAKGKTVEQSASLTAALARLGSFEPKSDINAWTKLIATRPEEQKLSLVITSITTGACDLDVEQVAQYLETLDGLCSDHDELIKAYWVLTDAIGNNHDAEYVLHGFRIRHALGKSQKFSRIEHSVNNLDWQLLLNIGAKHADKNGSYERLPHAYRLWEACGEAPHIVQLMEDVFSSDLDHEQIEEFIYFLVYPRYLDNDPLKTMDAKRKIAAKYARQLFSSLLSTAPKYRTRCVTEMKEYFWLPDTAECVDKNMAGFIALLPRLCAPPFSAKLDLLGTACGFTENFGIGVLSEASDKVLLALEAQCNNMQALVTSALSKLCEALPELTLRCLYSDTTKLCNVAKLFGTLPVAKERELLKEFKAHVLMQELGAVSLQEFSERVKPFVAKDIASPFSAKLSAYLEGKLSLTEDQIARGHRDALARLDGTRLDLLRKLIHEQLTASVPADLMGEPALHAMQIYNRSKENRRAFKSFLKAYFNGRPDYRENHPLSRQWLADHPKLDANLFRQGIVLSEIIEGIGTVTIAVEQDPFEALKLGTYVNSCFSLNGICNYSALAVVLDINKRVLYARDARGKVLARQIVVWDEADLLEAFQVYPEKTVRPLKLFFRKYDLAFAEALGTTVFDSKSWGAKAPDVINILSECWWDDGSWDVSELDEEEEEEEDKEVAD